MAAFLTCCCKGWAGLLAVPLLHTALSNLFQSPMYLLSSAFPISEQKGASMQPVVGITH